MTNSTIQCLGDAFYTAIFACEAEGTRDTGILIGPGAVKERYRPRARRCEEPVDPTAPRELLFQIEAHRARYSSIAQMQHDPARQIDAALAP